MAKKQMVGISLSPCSLSTGCTQQLGCAQSFTTSGTLYNFSLLHQASPQYHVFRKLHRHVSHPSWTYNPEFRPVHEIAALVASRLSSMQAQARV